ncbi:LysR substrate-binding domain-containing protein [Paracoccus sp. MBLB3053]|uniref:LysR substrate-binding domain-containing protein n=1 Tax=Paracoccus aurantius TaxID=3073814 RepID=A0ABU2HWV2_9RHOB|nr:LysR substrate-binding domain-containing protein [Paracoccus sp. MBLB3053]MDS9469089.1 LysR substrate-binding domain-containing protein [Paracoccus sp. MBLB3053]
MHPSIKLRHIRAFLDIAAEGGLSPVARAQGITQPALSRTLAELETLLEQQLFLRQGRRLALTESGALFRRHALAAIQALEAGASAMRPGAAGVLRVGVLPTVATRFLPQVVLRLRELRPEIVLAAETGPHFHLMRLLRDGAVDLVVGRLPGASEMSGLSFDHLYEDEVILVARSGHPARGRPATEALARSPVILPPATALIRPIVEDYLAAHGLNGVRPLVETVSLALGRGICLGSDALWFISRGVVLYELDRGELIDFPTGARFLSGAVGMTRRQESRAPGLVEFEQIAREVVRNADQSLPVPDARRPRNPGETP